MPKRFSQDVMQQSGRGEMPIEYLLDRQGVCSDARLAIEPNAISVIGYEFGRNFHSLNIFQEYDDHNNLKAAAIVAENIGSTSQMVTINQIGRLILGETFHTLLGYDPEKQAYVARRGSLDFALDTSGEPRDKDDREEMGYDPTSRPKVRNYTLAAMRKFLDYYRKHNSNPILKEAL